MMKINFFTTKPFAVDVEGKSYSLTKGKKILIVIAGVAGLALLGIGSIFTFYGASYLLRKHIFRKVNQTELKSIDNQTKYQDKIFSNLRDSSLKNKNCS